MTQPKTGGLRLRLVSGLLGAGLITMALLAIVVLLEVRDSLYFRRVEDARDRLRAATTAAAELCPPRGELVDRNCRTEIATVLALADVQQAADRCEAPMVRKRDYIVLCDETPTGGAMRLRVPLLGVQQQLADLDLRLLTALAVALAVLIGLAGWLLERGVVRRLSTVDQALSQVGAEELAQSAFLPEGGDALGRLGAAVNRLAERLREERERTRQQIVNLQDSNRLLAEEQRALKEAREDLVRSERLASVGRLAAGVAHEVGNPLSAVIAYAAVLRDRLAKLPEGASSVELVERIERESARVDRILRDLLDLARPTSLTPEPTELAKVLESARTMLEPQPRWRDAGTQLVVDLPLGLPLVRGHSHYLGQVMLNVLLNAAKAGAKTVRATARVDGERVRLELADDGHGISAEDLPRLFEPFFTTASPGEGTGLGLALCLATMERLGGTMTARQGESGGAVFELVFVRAGVTTRELAAAT
ncbi:MAG: two-component sensor histidine kinase [Deltaproteobacteria bacterium]|nr:two-component sensor histidine kinase [Deltaproteobacteria bacterium]